MRAFLEPINISVSHDTSQQNQRPKEEVKQDGMVHFRIWSAVRQASVRTPTIKTKQQITGNGFRQAVKESLFTKNGKMSLSGCFTGFYPHLISETMGRSLYYVVYEACKRSVKSYKEQRGFVQPEVTIQERMVSAAFAGVSCWALIYPFDVLRSRLYYEEGRFTTVEMIRTVHAEKAFYRGFLLTVLRAGPVAAAVLPVYDLVLERLS